MKFRLLALLTCALSLCAQDNPAPAPAPVPPAGLPPVLQGKLELEIDGKKEMLDLTDPATAARLKGKVIVVTEINGHREVRVVDAKEAEKLPMPFPWHEKLPVRTGPVTFLGVGAIEVPPDVAAQLTLPQDTGLQIAVVLPDSPAAKAGLQECDVVQKFEDQILISPRQLAVLIANRKEGDAVKLAVIRKGQPLEITVTLGKRDAPHVVESRNKMPNVSRQMVKLEGDADKVKALQSMILRRPADRPGEIEMKLHIDSSGTYRKDERTKELVKEGYQLFQNGSASPKRPDDPAFEDTGKMIRDALNKMPAEEREKFIKDLLKESDTLPKNALPPEQK